MHLPQVGTSLRILSCAESGCCIFSPLRTAISTFSLLWNLHHARCCSLCPNKWSVRKCDPLSWQCTLPETRVVAVIWLGSAGHSMCLFGSLREPLEVTYCRKMREWKWLFMNDCKCRSLIYGTVEFLSYCKGVVDASNFLGILLKIMIL